MGRVVIWFQGVALALGAPGIFLIAFIDSSFISLPELVDLLIVSMVAQQHSRLLLDVVAATTGSLAGCLVMYFIGKKGGEGWIRRRFAGGTVERAMGVFQRFGVMAVLVPCLLPPPMPFKIFVILAGVAGITTGRFAVAIALGRGARYLLLGLLAIRYGQPAMEYMKDHGAFASLVVAGVLIGATAAYVLWAKFRRPKADNI
jgi:membrane protein YqaA with SNARE-associated domain